MIRVRLLVYNTTEAHECRDMNDTTFLGGFNIKNENTYLQMIKFAFDNEITVKIEDSFYFIDDYMLSMPIDDDGFPSIDVFVLKNY